MPWSVERKVTAGFGLALLMLGSVGILGYKSARTLLETLREAGQAQGLLVELDDVPLLLARAEAAQRTYVLTGERRFLQSFQDATEAMQKEMADLRTFALPASGQWQRLDALEPLIAENFAVLQHTITIRESQGLTAATQDLLAGPDQKITTEIQTLIQKIEQEANAALQQHSTQAEEDEHRTILFVIFGSLMTFGLLTVAGLRIRRDLTEHARINRALHEARDELEQRVNERTRELAAANASLHMLSRQILEVQENERRHIARELHDELGQGLTSVKFVLQMLEDQTTGDAITTQVQKSVEMVDVMLQQVRQLSLNLRPSLLDDLGLMAALDWYVTRQGEKLGLVVHFTPVHLEQRPDPAVETACFRVVQEAFTNIARHAQAHHVWVTARRDGDRLLLSVRDDGVGFDPHMARMRAAQGGSFGILGMEERMTLVGSQFAIHSAPGRGTEIVVSVPL